jgi:hypothetical protein
MSLIKSKQRVADHGEVFTPPWMVEAMLDLVKDESERIDARFLEPACGSGNFLVQVLKRKLAAVEKRYGKSDFERRHFALFGLMCVYGIELLADNIAECRANLLAIFAEYLGLDPADDLYRAAAAILAVNVVQGDALTLLDHTGKPIVFPEWGYLGAGQFNRRDFRFDKMIQSANYVTADDKGTSPLFKSSDRREFYQPVCEYSPFSIASLSESLSKESS